MKSLWLAMICVVPGWSVARAADVPMRRLAPIEKGVAAFPRIAAPKDSAERRINNDLARLDAAMPGTIHECKTESPGPGAAGAYWSRKIAVTMAGPRFLAFKITDDAYCGGAHPATALSAHVFDLTTGEAADWTRLLPPDLTGRVSLGEGMDGVRTPRLASARLHALYLAGYGATAQGSNPDCREAVANPPDSPPPASVWPDAAAGGLAVQFDVAHVAEACALPVVIPLATLKAEGVSTRLTSAIAAAHRVRLDDRRE